LIIVGFSLVFICYNLINLPFRQAYHNYRANTCHIAQLIILFVTNYYDSMTENDTMDKKAYEFTPAEIQIAAIYVTVGVSMCCLIVEIYKFVRSKWGSTKIEPSKYQRQIMNSNEFNQTKEDLHED